MSMGVEIRGPQLNGAHYRITIVGVDSRFLTIESQGSLEDGSLAASGYLIDVLDSISAPNRANFEYELLSPSGQGSLCEPRLNPTEDEAYLYSSKYHSQYLCGQSDVTDLPKTNFTTDMYLGTFYLTNERLQLNRFTTPFNPPKTSAITMFGTATWVKNIPDFVQQQQSGTFGPACVQENTADAQFLKDSFPQMEVVSIPFTADENLKALQSGKCTVILTAFTEAVSFISHWAQTGNCHIDGNPIGIIGEPLDFGLSQMAVGVRKDIPIDFIDTWNYWLNVLMECSPYNSNDVCQNESLVTLYTTNTLGTGTECGYKLYPPPINVVAASVAGGIMTGFVVLTIIIFYVVYNYSVKKQEKRYKKRFVQQIARNIQITSAPGDIPVDKLANAVQHIGDKDGNISKEEFSNWLNDVKMSFLSEKDYNALWTAIDLDGKGKVDAIDFFVFMSSCGPEFQEVYKEEKDMPKMERLKLAARRLSKIQELGEDGVRRLENQLERASRLNVHTG